jgi:hypothetical protein
VSGRAAWEAFRAARDAGMDSGYGPDTFDEMHADWWDAAAQAAIDESDSTALAQLAMAREAIDDLAAERDRLTERVAELVSEGNQLRRRLRGLLTILTEGDEDDQDVRRRAIDHVHTMLEDGPHAVVTAGTEHIAAQITADRGEAGT